MVSRLFSSANWTAFNDAFGKEVDPGKPKAFLNYIMFSEHGDLIREGSGRLQANGDGTWQAMSTQIPVGNGDPEGGNVYFDLLHIRFTRGKLKEENHYYP